MRIFTLYMVLAFGFPCFAVTYRDLVGLRVGVFRRFYADITIYRL
jgi:hypothetical protein